jgi:3-hydroxyisobutyrate dehydrogenase-like beta-hydroxyacid dehydrogenase
VLLVHSTVAPATCELLAAAAPLGVGLLDAPVSGGRPEAYRGELVVMVGGDKEALDRSLPVLTTFAQRVQHLGPLGSGLRCKLLNNALGNAHKLLDMQMTQLAAELGIDVDEFLGLLRVSSGASYYTGTFREHGFDVFPHTEKDVRLAEDMLTAAAAPDSDLRAVWRRSAAVAAARRKEGEVSRPAT